MSSNNMKRRFNMSILHAREKWFNVVSSMNYAFKESYAAHERIYPLAPDRRNFDFEEAADHADQKSICMRKVNCIKEKKKILKDITIDIEPKKKYLVLGDEESGTEDLIRILTKEETSYEGNISIKDMDLRMIENHLLRREISLISSSIPVIRGSLFDNVTIHGKYDWMKVRDSMGKVGLLNLENENGEVLEAEELSDIDKKRISIARALVNHSSILILDETAGSENNEQDYEIEELILNMREMTVLSISHRLTKSLMEKYDRIFILDQGHIVEEGTFSELLLNNDYFYNRYVSSET